MKRSDALAPLSRDHQHALDAALRLRRADEESLAAAVENFVAFFEGEGRHHFEIEERLILPALPAGDADWDEGVARVRSDHAAIRTAAADLEAGPPDARAVEPARELGERLNDHVRFEERILFDLLERRLDPAALEQLGVAVAAAEAEPH